MSGDSTIATDARYQWSRLTGLQVGRYAEYYTQLRFSEAGYDVYSSEVDERGIDVLVRIAPGRCLEIQTKSLRVTKTKYVFFGKRALGENPQEIQARLCGGFCISLVLFSDGCEPDLFLIPGKVWLAPDNLFNSRDYVGLKSHPEFGISITKHNRERLEAYRFTPGLLRRIVKDLLAGGETAA